MAAGRQLRLLLWKDYLIRKRKVITLAGIVWATMVMLMLYVVRINIDNQDFPTCQFPARALPSAGMLTFVQSFVCSVNNECSPLDRFQEIPTYENSKLTKLQRQFSPLLRNETVLQVAETAPGALQLLAALADVLDHPTMRDISKNGLKVEGLFSNPARVRRYLADELNLTDAVAASVMDAQLTITGLFNGEFNRCQEDSVYKLLQVKENENMSTFVERLCALTDDDMQKMAADLVVEIDFTKYITMIGEMYSKLSKDWRGPLLARTATAALRLTRPAAFLPRALAALFPRPPDFTYFDAAWITKLMDQFEPAFGRTSAYGTLRDLADMLVMGLNYLDRVFAGKSGVSDTAGFVLAAGRQVGAEGLEHIDKLFSEAVDMIENAADDSIDIFKILAQVMNVINKILPEEKKHEVLFYSTLLAKLIEGANRVVSINLNIQEMAYDVSLRNPKGVKVLLGLPIHVVRKGFEGLADAERVQIVTSKLNLRGQIFCDSNKLAAFFKVSKSEADSLKGQLCTDAWKDYVTDLIKSFGIYDVKDIINNMASLVVQETFGKDTTSQLYTVEQDLATLKNFTRTLLAMRTKERMDVNWNKLFNVTDETEFMNIFKGRGNLGKQILITVHGALAKEIVKQNPILDFKISPILLDFSTLVAAVRDQLSLTPAAVTDAVRTHYPSVVLTMLNTLLDEQKTYKVLSTPSVEVVCRGEQATASYLVLPANSSGELVNALCGATKAIEDGLAADSRVAKAIAEVKNSSHGPLAEVNWTTLINGLKQIYLKLDADYPYLFEFTSYGMSREQQGRVKELMDEAKAFWFDARRLDRSLHLSLKVVFRLLDLVDRDLFGLRSEGWLKMKHAFSSVSRPLAVVDDFVKLLVGLGRGESPRSPLPPLTAGALQAFFPNLPRLLVDAVDVILAGDLHLEPIMTLMNEEPPWPCSNTSISSLLPLSPGSADAVQAAEDLLCLDSGLREEWIKFIHDRNISLYNSSTWNTTVFGPHVFLNFSGTFDALVEDTVLIKDLLVELVNESRSEGNGGKLTIVGAWKYAASMFNGTDRNDTLRKLFSQIDRVLDSISTDAGALAASALWARLARCGGAAGAACARTWRAAAKATLQALAALLRDASTDLLGYFTEINEPDASVLQLLGFTRGTGLRLLVDRLPELVAALLNSYWDYGFMSQIRRAALSDFWDCEAVLTAIAPAASSSIDAETIARIKPFVCPSLLYWISLPRGDNAFLDIVAKPQYTFFTLPAENLTSNFEEAFNKTTELATLLSTMRNKTLPTVEDLSNNTLQEKLKETVDMVLNYRLDETDPSYRLFNEVNKKQFMATIYLTRITAMVNKIAEAIDKLKPEDINKDYTEDEAKKVKLELVVFSKIFKRRPNEAIAVYFDTITNMLPSSDDNFSLVKAFGSLCDDFGNDDDSKDILNEGPRTKNQVCSKDYKVIFGAVQNVIENDYEAAKRSLFNLVNALRDSEDDVPDVVQFFKDRKKLTSSLRSSLKYSYELGMPVYLQYLQSNLQSFGVVLSFLSGGDWWGALRDAFSGPQASGFFDAAEMSLDVAEDVLTKLDEIHLVRLLRDVNVTDTASFCGESVSLGEYLPDASGTLARLQRQACAADREDIFKEIPPLIFASQGYDEDLSLSKDINYTALYSTISATEARLEAIRDGPRSPTRPHWVTDERIQRLRDAALQLLSRETLTKVAFGVISNVVDAGTLFLNNSQCALCSPLTSWAKQLTLQLYKKQEYEALLCRVPQLRADQLHDTLRNDFHWDMAYRELISSRNYTKLELNKALSELLGQVKLHMLEDGAAGGKLAACLLHAHDARDRLADPFTQAAIVLEVISRTLRLLEAELPHLHEVSGMADTDFFKTMRAHVAPALDAYRPLGGYLRDAPAVRRDLVAFVAGEVVDVLLAADVNLRVVGHTDEEKAVAAYLRTGPGRTQWGAWLCRSYDCKRIAGIIDRSLNKTLVARDLPTEQAKAFWTMSHIAAAVQHAARAGAWAARLLQLAGRLGLADALRGEVAPACDLALALASADSLETIQLSIEQLLQELQPILAGSALDQDLHTLTNGLQAPAYYRDALAKEDIRVPLGSLFAAEQLEDDLRARGVNATNFWSLAAPRLRNGYLLLKPIFTWKLGSHVRSLACSPDELARLLAPAVDAADGVTADDVLGAVAEQFCGMPDAQARRLLPVMIKHLNYSYVFEKVSGYLMTQLYTAANLSTEAGTTVTARLPRLAATLPALTEPLTAAAASLGQDPLLRQLANFSGVGALLGSSEFLASAGNMLCGSPFVANIPRLFRSVLANEDHADEPARAQLEGLPTEFCRSLYLDIISAEGGKIVWSFVKPLLMGRVLYTPPDPLVQRIIQRANSSFAHMARLASLVHSFAGSFPAVEQLSDHREGVAVLSRLLASPAFKDLRTSLLGDVEMPEVKLEDVFDEFGDLNTIGRLVDKVSSLLRCVNLNRFHAAASEDELAHTAAQLTMLDEFSAGLVFLNSGQQGAVPTNLKYKIRMDIDNVPTTSRMKNYLWIPGPEASFLENMRYFRGFVQLQDLVNQAVVAEAAASRRQRRSTDTDQDDKYPDWAVYTQQMPYPCYRKDFFQTSLYESQALIVALFFSLLFSVAAAVRFIVADHESGNTMLMHVMGVNLSLHTLSWFLWASLETLLTAACATLVLSAGRVLPRSSPGLVLALLVVFGFSVLCFCYMLSKLFRAASFGAVCAGVAYLVSFMPFVLILSLEAVISRAAKILISLSMSSSVCYAFLHVTRLEAMGAGAHWDGIWDTTDPEDVSIGLAVVMMLLDAAVYVAIGLLIDRFCGLKRLQSNITQCRSSDEKAGVSVVGVSMRYGSRLALDNVSLELHRGQLTTLLGHNGAGKTTLINILTGMVRPTRGHVVVRSDRSHGARLGVCPQRDVLFPHMSPREHVALYAQLKSGRALAELRDEVDSILGVLSLGPVSEQPVWALSGGTRRRLCVALAFVCEPHLVSLDEPTSGVDPAARRDIWSMIVKLKEERTILMTTHHLDEAELLSDQIVIMHKGQVHTTGSPIEIKRTLGTGYRLTVTYPHNDSDDTTDEPTVEERSKVLLGAVRDVIANASLIDVNGLNVELSLPFYDANGLNNDFLQLCTAVEDNQQTLGFRSYALDCSSLEQVFHNVCQQAERPAVEHIRYDTAEDIPSKSTSTSSIRPEGPLVSGDGPRTGSWPQQLRALMLARFLHYTRDRWLLFVVLILPSLFVGIAMAFSTIRPPADNEVSLLLSPELYPNTTEFVVPQPSDYSDQVNPTFAQQVMDQLMFDRPYKNWTAEDTPTCSCSDATQTCDAIPDRRQPPLMVLPDVATLNDWIVSTQQEYIQKRYAGYATARASGPGALVAWYNNKGHHALPAALGALHSAALRAASGRRRAAVHAYSHPMKISKEQISKDTVYQHVADAGISGLMVVAYSLVSAGAAVYLVTARCSQEKRLQLLAGVSPTLYWTAALAADMIVILLNMVITVILMEAFHFPVFVERNNLPAICLLILLYGFSCGSLVHVAEKLFSDASVANMLLFCGNAFLGLGGNTVLLILDVISDSERTDNARWLLHKIFMLSPQFALGDGLLEIAKNTIQAQVLSRFGMDTYRDPLGSSLVAYHYVYMVLVGALLFLLNLAIEYQAFDSLLAKFQSNSLPLEEGVPQGDGEGAEDVAAERARVAAGVARGEEHPLRLRTIGNINAGFVESEGKALTPPRFVPGVGDVAACVGLSKAYGNRVALRDLTLGIPPGQCTALLGENGAGKSTTFALLTGQLRPGAGALLLRGVRCRAAQLARGLVGYCPQSDAVDPLLTVRETLDIYCQLRGIAERDEVIARTLSTFELEKYADTRAGELSGGNKRKLCTAIAFMSRSPLILLDEPTSGMDPGSRGCVSRGVRAACGAGRGVLVSTHALGDARALAARVALLRAGRLRALASLDDCLARFGGGYVVECVVSRGRARAAWRRLQALAPQAQLRVLHHAALHFLLPTKAIVSDKEVITRLSDIFRLMAQLQGSCDIEDYTVNQSSLEQMFLSFSERSPAEDCVDVEPLPGDLTSVTSL